MGSFFHHISLVISYALNLELVDLDAMLLALVLVVLSKTLYSVSL